MRTQEHRRRCPDDAIASLVMDERKRVVKLYKFRSLGDELAHCRAMKILRTGEFWCSRFWELNDPMEGVYRVSNGIDLVKDVFDAKSRYLICSFSGDRALSNPLMWGCYANGFKGLAIEIEVPIADVRQVKYTRELPLDGWPQNIQCRVKEILTTKLSRWKHEHEFRRLLNGDETSRAKEIGKITGVCFGDPYGDVANPSSVFEKSSELRAFRARRDDLEHLARAKGFCCNRVRVCGTKVERIK